MSGNLEGTSLDLAFDWFDKMSLYIDHLFDIQKEIELALMVRIRDLADKKWIPIISCICIIVVRSVNKYLYHSDKICQSIYVS